MVKNKIIFASFFTTALLIVFLHFIYHPVRVLGMDTSIFYMDEKVTLAAFYSTIISFLVGFLTLFQIDKIKKQCDKGLLILFSSFFLFLSIDEYFEIHEYVNTTVKNSIKEGTLINNLAHVSWIFPLSVFILFVFVMFILLMFREREKSVRLPFTIGIICYGLVLILEVIGGQVFGRPTYVIYVGLEEGFEMIGGSLFLLSVLNRQYTLQ